MNKNKIFKSLKLNLFITIFTGIMGFIINKYFSQYMGIEKLGLMRLFSQLIACLSLAELGVGVASTYLLYKPLAEKKYEDVSIITSTIDSIYKKISIFILTVGLVLNFLVPFLAETNISNKKIYLYWTLYILNTSLGYAYAKYSIVFMANQEYFYVRKIQGIAKILSSSIQIISIIYLSSFSLYILILILENIITICFYRNHYKNKYFFIEKVNKRDYKIIKNIKNLFWHQIGTVIVFNTDYILISKFVNISIVGKYSSYLMVSNLFSMIIGIITPVLKPNIGKFISENTKDKIYKKWQELYIIYFFIASILIYNFYSLVNPFIKVWLGSEYLLEKNTVILIAINLFISMTRGVTDIFKSGIGFFDDTYSPIIESVLNLSISLFLVEKMGLNGVIIGTVISNIVVILLLKPILVFKKIFNQKIFKYILILVRLLLLSGISISLIIWTFKIFQTDFENIISWEILIIKSIIIQLVVVPITFFTFMLDKYFRGFIFDIFLELDFLVKLISNDKRRI